MTTHTITLHCDDAAYAAIVEEVRFRLGDDAVPESGLRSLSGSVISDIIHDLHQPEPSSHEKKLANRVSSPARLMEAGIKFETKNHGEHLIVESPEGKIDFWPATGLWRSRIGARGRGVFNLIRHLNNMKPKGGAK